MSEAILMLSNEIITIHQEAQRRLGISKSIETSFWEMAACYPRRKDVWNKKRLTKLRDIAKEAVKEATRLSASHLARDFRVDVGSGRSAYWFKGQYDLYALVCLLAHKELGFSGEACRQIGRVVADMYYCHGSFETAAACLPPCPVDTLYWDNGYSEEFTRKTWYADKPEVKKWHLWATWRIGHAYGEQRALHQMQELTADPTQRISGYLADSIISWRQNKAGYEGCSHYQYVCWFKQHPEHWDFLLSRAPTGAVGDGWEQVFPHEHTRADELRKRGWLETLRMSDSVFEDPAHPGKLQAGTMDSRFPLPRRAA